MTKPSCYKTYSSITKDVKLRNCENCARESACKYLSPRDDHGADDRILTLDDLAGMGVQADARTYQEGGAHYKQMGVQPWDVIDTWGDDARIGFFQGNALKYLMRMGVKEGQDPVLEIKKARHYCDKLIEVLEGAA